MVDNSLSELVVLGNVVVISVRRQLAAERVSCMTA